MRKLLPIMIFMLLGSFVCAQSTIAFHENFEQPGLGDSVHSSQQVSGTDDWGISSMIANSGSYSDTAQVMSSATLYLTTDTFSTSGNSNVFLQFAHICKVDFQDAAEIEVWTGGNWIKLTGTQYMGSGQFASLGDKFSAVSYVNDWAPSNASAIPTNSWWKTEQFEISSIAGNQAQVAVRFKLTDGGVAGAGGNYGWAIDDIKITMSYSELIPPVITLQSPVLLDSVYNTGPFDIYSDITDASGIDTAWLIYSRNNAANDTLGMINTGGSLFFATIDTIPAFSLGDTVCYKVVAFDASPASNMAMTPSSGCNQFVIYSSPPPPGCTSPISNFPVFDGFEGTSLWTNATSGDDMNWTQTSGGTSSFGTGPNGANTGTYYMYTETSGYNNMTAILNGPCIDLTGMSAPKMEFYYHMYGATMGTLEVQIYYGGSWLTIWSISGQQQTSNGDPWIKADINLIPYKSVTQLRFKALTGSSYTSDMCIDDIKIWQPPDNDIGIVSIDKPNNPALTGQQAVKMTLKNFGANTVTSAQIRYEVNGVPQIPISWTGTLPAGVQIDSLTVDSFNFQAGQSTIKAWTRMPNGVPDTNNLNDTAFASIIACVGNLNGTYTIGGSSPDYSTFNDAYTALTNCGVGGPVTFNVAAGTYTEQLLIGAIPGVSASHTVSFQSASGVNTDVILQYASTSTTDNYTVKLDAASYIAFKNMTIKATGASYAYVVAIENGSNHNTFEGNIIETSLTTSSYGRNFHIYNGLNNYNVIKDNDIKNGYYSLYIYGSSSASLAKGNVIMGNNITDFYYYGLYNYYQDSLQIIGNYIENMTGSVTVYGIRTYYCDNFAISKNQLYMHGSSTNYGMYIYYSDGTASKPNIIANNFISQSGGTGTVYGINNYYSYYNHYYYNSFNITGGSISGSRCFYAYGSSGGGGDVTLKNNIFVNTAGGYTVYAGNIGAISSSDYNNLYTTGTNLAYWGSVQSTLSAWQSATNMDVNSLNLNPGYASLTDLHINVFELDSAGTPIPGIYEDFDGDTRDTLKPDIGADEFYLAGDDAGIFTLVEPQAVCAGSPSLVKVSIKNFGTDTLTSAYVDWEINGVPRDSVLWTGLLLPTEVDTVTLGPWNFQNGVSYDITSWSFMPNNVTDGNNTNDTLYVTGLKTALAPGTYTIGTDVSDDFASFTEVANHLNTYGICGSVVFLVDTGTYSEQIELFDINGSAPNATVTFQSANGDSTSVVLTYAPSSTLFNYTVRLNGADNIRFKKMTIESTGISYGRVIEVGNNAHNNQFKNLVIQGAATTSTSTNYAVVFSAGTTDSLNAFMYNKILDGSHGIYWYGASSSALESNTTIIGNRFVDQYYSGIYVQNQNAPLINDNYVSTTSTYTSFYGLRAEYCDNGMEITGNEVLAEGSNYALYVRYCDASAAQYGLIANNIVVSGGSGTNYGFYFGYNTFQEVYYNSVNVLGTSTSGRAFYLYGSTSQNNIIKNNAFANAGGGYAVYASIIGTNLADYNNLYTTGSNLGYYNGAQTNLTNWTGATALDSNSVSVDPMFLTSTNLHTISANMNALATPVSVVTDIDGDLRNPVTPDIGADEFDPVGKNAAMVDILNPLGGCGLGLDSVKVRVTNDGIDTINGNLVVGYYLDGNTNVVLETVPNTILPYDTVTYTFSTPINLATTVDTNFSLLAFTKLQGDPVTFNDTAYMDIFSGVPAVAPIVSDTTIPYGSFVTLTALSPDTVIWYQYDTSTVELATGATYTTPILFDTITYWVEAQPGGLGGLYTIGTGTTQNSTYGYPSPYGQYYNGVREQFLILASELQAAGVSAGPINSVAFDVVTPAGAALVNFEVKMGHSSQSSLSTWESNLTTVYSIASYSSVVGWNTHQFSVPFVWDGSSNVVIETCFDNYPTGYTTNAILNQSGTSFASTLDYHSDGGSVCTTLSPYPSTYMQRPNMQLLATTPGCPSPRVPLTVNVQTIPPYDAGVDSLMVNTGCGLTTTEPISIQIYNQGTDTITSGLSATYQINNNPPITPESVTSNIVPGDSIMYTFTTLADLSAPTGDTLFSIKAWVSHASDPNKNNDTIFVDTVISNYTTNPPMASDTNITYGTYATLVAIPDSITDSIYWYDVPNGGTELGSGNVFTTPVLYNTTVYYVEAVSGGAANMYTFGTGTTQNTSTSYPCPYGQFYNGTREQFLILASELQAQGIGAGPIQSVAFDVVTPAGAALINFEVKLGHTTQSSMSSWESNMTTVFSNASYTTVSGWNTHTFSVPFIWDGVSNLVIETCFDNYPNGYTTNAILNQTSTSFSSTLDYHSDGGSVCTTTSSYPTSYQQRPNMQIIASGGVCPSQRIPVTVYVTGQPPYDAGVTSISDPTTDFDLTANEDVVVEIKNSGSLAISNFQVSYQVDQQNPVTETVSSTVNPGDSLVYTFNAKADLSSYAIYNVKAYTSLSGDTTNANDTAYKSVENMQINYCACSATSTGYEDLTNVTLSNLNNTSAAVGAMYSDFTLSVSPAIMQPGQTYNISITSDFPTGYSYQYTCWVNVFIDWNRDGTFDTNTERPFGMTTTSSNTVTGTITVPQTAVTGIPTRMRVVLRESGSVTNTGPCGTYTWGETEDYTVIVTNPVPEDAGISEVVDPAGSIIASTALPVNVRIKNYGTDTLTKATVNWSVDGVSKPAYVWTGSLLPDSVSSPITIATDTFSTGSHCLKAWTIMPNDSVDVNNYNDTSTSCFYACQTILSGPYTIGGTNPDFQSLADAVTALNNCGVNGPVVFNIAPGTYSAQIVLNEILGTSATNTVTFQSSTNNAADVTITFSASSSTDNYTFYLDGADYVILKNLTITAGGTSYARAVVIGNSATNNEINACIINSVQSTSSNAAGIYSSGSNDDNNTIKNNTINYGYYGIYYYGASNSNLEMGTLIENNTIKDWYYYGIYLSNQDAPQVLGNTIDNTNGNSSYAYALYAYYCDNAMEIMNNKINIVTSSTAYGMRLYYCNGSGAGSGLIANNFITENSNNTNTHYGIYSYYSTMQDYYYNTVNMTSGSTSARAFYHYNYSSSSQDINLKNNVFVNNGGGYAIYISSPSTIATSDYNDFYTSGSNLGYWNGIHANLSSWQTSTYMDANSISHNPVFISNTNLHTTDIDLNAKGTPIPSVLKDIDGDPRDSLNPDMGADEFTPSPIDLGASALISPIAGSCFGSAEVLTIEIKNHGLDTLYFATDTAFLHVNVTGPNSYTFPVVVIDTGMLPVGQSMNILVDTAYNMSAGGAYNFYAHTVINNDGNSINDSMSPQTVNVFATISTFPFIEDFETSTVGTPGTLDNGWTIDPTSGFTWYVDEGGTPSTSTGPTVDHTLGTSTGNYVYTEGSSSGQYASLISPCLDLNSMTNPHVKFWYHFYGSSILSMYTEVNYGGVWYTVDTIQGQQQAQQSDPWLQHVVDLSGYSGIVKIRFRALKGASFYCDMALDDIYVYEPMPLDAGVKKFVLPDDTYSDVGASAPVSVIVENYGYDTITSMNVGFIVGTNVVTESYSDTLLPNMTDTFAFTTPMSAIAGQFNLCAFTDLTGDGNTGNDTNCITHTGVPVLQIPFMDDFESTTYFFGAGGINEWEHGIPQAMTINSAHSSANVWATNLFGHYSDNTNGYLYTPKFDLSTYGVDSLKFWHWLESEPTNDGGYIQYLNIQGNWSPLGSQNDTSASNWYNSYSNGQDKWTGQTGGWIQSTYDLSVVQDLGNIAQFRFVFNTNASSHSFDGWAIDDFELTLPKIPEDAGVIAINTPIDTVVIGSSQSVEVVIQNFGIDTLYSVPIDYVVNNGVPKSGTWTGTLAPNATAVFSFSQVFNATTNASFGICANTNVNNDTYFFNDSTCKTVVTKLPALDAGIIDIIVPGDSTCVDEDISVTVRIKNMGLDALSNMQVAYKFRNNPPVVESWSGTLANTGDSVDFTFSTPYNTTLLIGNYDFTAYTMLPSDGYYLNDTVVITVINHICPSGIGESGLDGMWLGQNIPNPATKTTTIEYTLPKSGEVVFRLTNLLGEPIEVQRIEGHTGRQTIELDVDGMPAGVYYYSIDFEGTRLVKKMVVNK